MKILWFVNVPMPKYLEANGRASVNVGGWMGSLLDAVRRYAPEVELSVVFEDDQPRVVEIDGIRYFGIDRKDVVTSSARIVRNVSPAIIHLHGSDGISLKLPKEILCEAPSVLSIQGIINGYSPYYLGGLSPVELKRHRNPLRDLAGFRDIVNEGEFWRTTRSKRESELFGAVTACLGRTDWDYNWAKYLAPQVKYFHVGEIMRDAFYAGRRNRADVVPHTVYCSAALSYPLKGGHWLLRAIASLKRKYPDIVLSVANGLRITDRAGFMHRMGKNEYYRYLTALIQELGLQGHVRLLPSLDAGAVREELSRAELFCLPSLIENSPNSLCEAMLTGVPAVATDAGGTSSLLESGTQGLLIPGADPAALACAIDQFFSNPREAERCATVAYETARERHSPPKVVAELMLVYRTLAGGN